MRELETRKIEYNLVFTDQHKVTTDELLSDFGILQSRCFSIMKKSKGPSTNIFKEDFVNLPR